MSNDNTEVSLTQRSSWLAFLIPAALLATTLFLFYEFSRTNQSYNAEVFNRIADNSFNQIREAIRVDFQAVESVASFFEVSPNASRSEFSRFVARSIASCRSIKALEWIPKVEHEERLPLEREIQKQIPDFSFKRWNELTSKFETSTENWQPDFYYFPVLYLEPLAENEEAHGIDLASNPERRTALLNSLDRQELTVTAPIRLAQQTDDTSASFLVFAPVYGPAPIAGKGEALDQLLGFALGVFDFREIVRPVTEQLASVSVGLIVEDVQPTSDPRQFEIELIYPDDSKAINRLPGGHRATPGESPSKDDPQLYMISDYGRTWSFRFIQLPGFELTRNNTMVRLFAVTGLLLSLLTFLFLKDHANRTRKIEKLVQIRTAVLRQETEAHKLTAEELRRSKDLAEQATRAKSDFLARMSHEIRTPINSIVGMTELVKETPLTREQNDYLKMVTESADLLLAIIDDILDLSKIEAQHLTLEIEEFDFRDEIGKTIKSLSVVAHRRGLELAVQFDPEIPRRVISDPVRLKQLLVNLINNAIKFTREGEVFVDIKPVAKTTSELVLQVEVRDTGIGIEPENFSKIFNLFEQADNSITREFGGTGLGLAISASIVEAMHGKIWLESTVGQGTSFFFRIAVKPGSPTSATNGHFPELHGQLVILADQHDTHRNIVSRILDRLGATVVVARSNREIIDELERNQPENQSRPIVMISHQKPELDAVELAEQLRNNPATTGIAIVVMHTAEAILELSRLSRRQVIASLIRPPKEDEIREAIIAADSYGISPGTDSIPQTTIQPAIDTPAGALRILVAEDGQTNRLLMTRMLQKWGHQVTVAADGQETIQKFLDGPFDLILMDVHMPVVDGIAATRQIREYESKHGGHIAIVAVTAQALPGDRQRFLAAGMDGYVSKPIRWQELNRAIAASRPDLDGNSVES